MHWNVHYFYAAATTNAENRKQPTIDFYVMLNIATYKVTIWTPKLLHLETLTNQNV